MYPVVCVVVRFDECTVINHHGWRLLRWGAEGTGDRDAVSSMKQRSPIGAVEAELVLEQRTRWSELHLANRSQELLAGSLSVTIRIHNRAVESTRAELFWTG